MSTVRVLDAVGELDLELPLGALVLLEGDSESVQTLAFDILAPLSRRDQLALLQVPGAEGDVPEAVRAYGLPATFTVRRTDAHWPRSMRVGHILGILPEFAAEGVGAGEDCLACGGEGRRAQVDVNALIADVTKSIEGGAIASAAGGDSKFFLGVLRKHAAGLGLDLDSPWRDLTKAVRARVLYGEPETGYRGVVADVERRLARAGEGRGADRIEDLLALVTSLPCELCTGTGVQALAGEERAATLCELYATPISRGREAVEGLAPPAAEAAIARAERAELLGLGEIALGCHWDELPETLALPLRLCEVLAGPVRGALLLCEAPGSEHSLDVSSAIAGQWRAHIAGGGSVFVVGTAATEADVGVRIAVPRLANASRERASSRYR